MAQNQNLGRFAGYVTVNTSSNAVTFSSNTTTFGNSSVNTTINSTAIAVYSVIANGGLGTNGQALTTNGSSVYWSTIVGTNTDAQYTWTNTHTFSNNVVINGNLTISGTTTTVNTATLDVKDLNITVAKGSSNGSVANGAGLTVDGAAATWLWDNSLTSWVSNVSIKATSGTISVGNSTINTVANSTAVIAPFGFMNRQIIDYNYTVPADLNAVLVGPVTVANGFTLAIANGGRLAVV